MLKGCVPAGLHESRRRARSALESLRAAAHGARGVAAHAGASAGSQETSLVARAKLDAAGDVDLEHLWNEIWSTIELGHQHSPSSRTSPARPADDLASCVTPEKRETKAEADARRARAGKQPKHGSSLALGPEALTVAPSAKLKPLVSAPATACPAWPKPRPARALVRSRKVQPSLSKQQLAASTAIHYGVLGLRRSASLAEVRAAFRRLALQTHPDKGGDPVQFHAVAAAFEELEDPDRRAAYDKKLVQSGSTDGLDAAEEQVARCPGKNAKSESVSTAVAPRALYEQLLDFLPATWPKRLLAVEIPTLKALRDLADQLHKLHGMAPAHDEVFAAERSIHKHNNGLYSVTVSWSSLKVMSGRTRSLAQAIDWHVALTRVKSSAARRLAGSRRTGAGDELIQDEMLAILKEEPHIQLAFQFTVQSHGRTVVTPASSSLKQAKEFRHCVSRATKRTLDKALGLAAQDAQQSRRSRHAQGGALVLALCGELRRRAVAAAGADGAQQRGVKRGADASAPMLALPQPLRRLRYKTSPLLALPPPPGAQVAGPPQGCSRRAAKETQMPCLLVAGEPPARSAAGEHLGEQLPAAKRPRVDGRAPACTPRPELGGFLSGPAAAARAASDGPRAAPARSVAAGDQAGETGAAALAPTGSVDGMQTRGRSRAAATAAAAALARLSPVGPGRAGAPAQGPPCLGARAAGSPAGLRCTPSGQGG
ncbi:unnamed protein product [Prorocentrum cordatum]|uniref:J domain-containing protein n=1 Tax=Prorocentrum cordatum TaxID=2364126 RepID=A0ABN9SF58_9DINO|nr:unnamed protein product [Polarella glacialis]